MTCARSRRGMTLIEAMVAVVILSIITTVVYGGFSQTMRNKARLEEQADRAHVIRVAMERIVRELSQAFVSVHVNPNASMQASVASGLAITASWKLQSSTPWLTGLDTSPTP